MALRLPPKVAQAEGRPKARPPRCINRAKRTTRRSRSTPPRVPCIHRSQPLPNPQPRVDLKATRRRWRIAIRASSSFLFKLLLGADLQVWCPRQDSNLQPMD
jgi:hypothetical protein